MATPKDVDRWKPGRVTKDVDCLCCKDHIPYGSACYFSGRKFEGSERWEGMKDLRSFLCRPCYDEYSKGTKRLIDISRYKP